MTPLLITIHIIVCLFMIVIVLLQHGKGADIGATFGGSGQALFGTEGPLPLLNKITTGSAVIFMVTSVSLAYLSAHRNTGTVMSGIEIAPEAPAPVEMVVDQPTAPITVPMPDSDGEAAPAPFPLQSDTDKKPQEAAGH